MRMNNNRAGETIIDMEQYQPVWERDQNEKMRRGWLGRVAWAYTHELGQNFTFVLAISLLAQAGVAVFISFGVRNLAPIASLAASKDGVGQALATIISVLIGLIIQALLIAEAAEVVWLYRTDKLKIRLMRDSLWWKIMLVALIASSIFDFFMLFMAITGTRDLKDALTAINQDQLTLFSYLLIMVLDVLTLIRSASVMKTSSAEEIRHEVEDRIKAIAEEILLDAGDATRKKAAEVWKRLNVNPANLLPLPNAVLDQVKALHPDMFPPQLGGSSWGYNTATNTVALLPPDVHQALLHGRRQAQRGLRRFLGGDGAEAWRGDNKTMLDIVESNVEQDGAPSFIDMTNPDEPKFLTAPVDFGNVFTDKPVVRAQHEAKATANKMEIVPASLQSEFVATLSPKDRVLFGTYLTHTVFPHAHGVQFPKGEDLTIWEAFDEVELQWYYRYWKKHQATVNQAQ